MTISPTSFSRKGGSRRPKPRAAGPSSYVSPDFRRHAASTFIEPLFDRHDRSSVELFAYSQAADEDEVTARLKEKADGWLATRGMDDAQLAERIRTDGIDVLVDLAGHTRGNRLPAFARKPAPVSVTTIGFVYTTGLSSIARPARRYAGEPADGRGRVCAERRVGVS